MASNYWVSTQCNHWIVTRAQIAIARAEDTFYASSPEEHYALRIFFVNSISLLAKRLYVRQRVTVTAIIFFHRFYSCASGNSFCSTDPTLVVAACLYVASKVEETPIHIRNVSQESSKLWSEMGYNDFPKDIQSLAEMEFYLLEDLQFHLVVYHPFRSLVAIYTAAGKGAPVRPNFKQSAATSWNGLLGASLMQVLGTTNPLASTSTPSPVPTPVGAGDLGSMPSPMEPDLAYGSPGSGLGGKKTDEHSAAVSGELQKVRQLDKQTQARVMQEMMDERNRMFLYAGDDDMPLPRLEELDEQVLQMAWFVLNDSYRTDLLLLYPPHIVAVAAIFLGLVLHDGTREKMLRSKRWMQESRERYYAASNGTNNLGSKGTPETADNNKGTPVAVKGTSNAIGLPGSPSKPVSSDHAPAPSPAGPTTPSASAMASPPAGQSGSQATQANKSAPRGLASLPPRPSHLPPKPMVAPGQSWQLSAQHNTANRPSAPQGNTNVPSPARDSQISPQPQATTPGRPAVSDHNVDNNAAVGLAIDPAASTSNGAAQSTKAPSVAVPHLPTPPPDALTFLASLNVDLDAIAEVVQEMLSLYDFWHRVGTRNTGSTPGNADATQSTTASTDSPSGQAAASSSVEKGTSPQTTRPTTSSDTPDQQSAIGQANSALNGSGDDWTHSIYIGNAPDMLRRLHEMRDRRHKDLVRIDTFKRNGAASSA